MNTVYRHQLARTLLATAVAATLPALSRAEDTPVPSPPVTQETELPPVTVTEGRERGDQGYQATRTGVGKVVQDPHDVPQAVTTITHSLMEDQQVGSLREALRNVSGLTFNAAEGGRSGDNMMLRGFYTFGDMYLDGIRDTAQYNRETFNLEQVDVLRGSAAMLFGRGQAGGVINQASKTPALVDRHKLTGSLGGDGYQEMTGDLNQHLGNHNAVRVNLMQRNEGSWRSNPVTGTEPEVHRSGVAISAGTGLYTANSLTLSHLFLQTQDNPDYGVPFDSVTKRPTTLYPASTFWGIDRNFDDSQTNITTLTHQLLLAPQTQLRTQLRYASYQRAYWASAPSNTAPPDTDGNSPKIRKMDTDNLVLQSDLSRRFIALDMTHDLLAGVEYLREDARRWNLLNLGSATAPYYLPNEVNGAPTTYQGNTVAVYLQDTVEFIPDWKATVGARRDEMKADYELTSGSPPAVTSTRELDFGEWSYRAALSWQPTAGAHYYLGWSDSFSPTADLYQTSAATPYPAERSQVTELGAKWLLLDGDLAFRTALYRATKEWERNNDLESTAGVLSRKRRTDGLEFELAGRVTPNWEVFAGLALMHAKILEVAENTNATTGVVTVANPNFEGQSPANTPPYTFNLWTTYSLGGGWKIGGGVEAKGKRYGYNTSAGGTAAFNPNTVDAYARWDAILAYEQKRYGLRLNIQNLLDELYYDALYVNGGFTVPGTGRRFILTGELKF